MKYTDAEIQKYIKSGLMAYKENLKCFYRDYPRTWKGLPLKERVEIARSLVFMSRVAKDPKQYFSPKYTYAQWSARAKEYAEKHNLSKENAFAAYYIVDGPKDIVESGAQNAINELSVPTFFKYANFLDMIQKYEYADNDWEKERCAESIITESKRVNEIVEINQTPWLLQPIKRMEIMFRSGNSK